MRDCNSVPKLFEEGGVQCNLDMYSNITDNTTCINWNQYYTNCSDSMINPFKGAINFDNIFYAWIAIFQVKVYSYQGGRKSLRSGLYHMSDMEMLVVWLICDLLEKKDSVIAFVYVSAKTRFTRLACYYSHTANPHFSTPSIC